MNFTTTFAGSKQLALTGVSGQGYSGAIGVVGAWTVPAPFQPGTTGSAGGTGADPDPIYPTPTFTPPPPVTSPKAQDCSDLSGTWSDPNIVDPSGSAPTWSLLQDSNGGISGTLTGYCDQTRRDSVKVVYNVYGNTSSFNAYSTDPSGSVTCNNGMVYALNPVVVTGLSATCSDAGVGAETANPAPPGLGMGFAPAPPQQPPTTRWSRTSNPPGVTVTADIMSDQVLVSLDNPNKYADLSVSMNGYLSFGDSGPFQPVSLGAQTGVPGSSQPYQFSIGRAKSTMPYHVEYTSITATWGTLSASVPVGFGILGNTRFSQYNNPAETACGNPNTNAYVFYPDRSCVFTKALLNGTFIHQADLNGTGTTATAYNYTSSATTHIIKPWRTTTLNSHGQFLCGVPTDGSLDSKSGNIFVAVAAVTGTCNSALADGISLAVYPSPKPPGAWSCGPDNKSGDPVLLVDSGDNNVTTKYAQDACPACIGDTRSGVSHIDTYSVSPACKPGMLLV